ncbi:MAG: GNAT family N-acetyltransferase [Actinobacteria bacterium]|nr:GNAT family N-acetyltransferase [Actinomycetota bacterium]
MAPVRIDLEGGAQLRLLVPEDAPLVFETVDRERERLRPWLPWVDSSIGPADTRAFIEATIATEGREFAFGIWLEDRFAGAIGLHTDPKHRSAMIGFWIDAEHEGQGLVTRASEALTEIAFRDFSMHRVWLSADPHNRRSCAVAERLGFEREGVHRQDTLVDGRFRDTVIYAILEQDWPGSR